jgi:hypothetical protein
MKHVLQYIFWAVGISLQVLVISALIRGLYKKYAFIFAYCVCLLLTTVIEASAYTAKVSGSKTLARSWGFYYWADEAVLQALTFWVVISLVLQAMASGSARRMARRWLIVAAIVVFVILFLVHAGPRVKLNLWMTLISRDLNFAAMILDLMLWLVLIASPKKDPEVLLLTAGFGIQFTGGAIGQSLRQLSRGHLYLQTTGDIILVLSYFVCMYVWWQTFRAPKSEAAGHRG